MAMVAPDGDILCVRESNYSLEWQLARENRPIHWPFLEVANIQERTIIHSLWLTVKAKFWRTPKE